jgi:hypothetical protein
MEPRDLESEAEALMAVVTRRHILDSAAIGSGDNKLRELHSTNFDALGQVCAARPKSKGFIAAAKKT